MGPSTKQQLADIGKRLTDPPHSKDALLKSLKESASLLSELEQSPELSSTLQPLTQALISPSILKNKDKEVRLVALTCMMEIARILAPSAPYTDDVFKEIFQLIVNNLQELDELAMPGFARRTTILEIMAKFKICVLMLDLECDDLIMEMFKTFFKVISEKHPPPIWSAMQTIMVLILEESEEISQSLLELVLSNLLKEGKCTSPAAHKLSVNVIEQCADKLELYVQRFMTSIMLEGKASESDLRDNYHDIIYEIYKCAPQMLLSVIPNLAQELVSDQVDMRLKAVQLLGKLFALPGQHVAKEYRQLFGDFLRRFTDKVMEVRLAMVNCAKQCLKECSSGHESAELLAALCDRILDNEDKIRVQVVNTICDLAIYNLKCIPVSLIKQVAERLRDKKVVVRKEALQKLVEVYRAYCIKCYKDDMETEETLELIPSKIIRCCFDKEVKDFRPAGIEITFSEELFAAEIPVSKRVKHWMCFYANFDENDKKALTKMLFQKRRLQTEMSEYISLRQKLNAQHNQDFKIEVDRLFKSMSSLFTDDQRAEEGFQKLHAMKDKNVFKSLTQLLDPNTTFSKSQAILDDLLHRIGQNYPQLSFIKQIAIRCSFRLFGKDHIKAVVREIRASEDARSKDLIMVGLSLLSEFTGFCPLLIEAVKDELIQILMDGDEAVKEGVAEILAKAGGLLRCQIGESRSHIEATLQKLCLEGSRKQAKYAVTALSAINNDSSFKSLSLLYAHLLESMTEGNPHLPTVLQSLACIAQNSISIFETREDDIIRFVVRKLLRKDSDSKLDGHDDLDSGWDSISAACKLKIFGLKMLVKSFFPNKEHIRKRMMGLLGVLYTIISSGEISEEVKSSEIDKAHLRLAAALGVLRLARHLDAYVPPEISRACLFLSQDSSSHLRSKLLLKIHQYLKDRTLNHKYACGFALYATDSSKEILQDARHYLSEFVEFCYREASLRATSMLDEKDTTPIIHFPEYVIVYLVHLLAHHPNFPNRELSSQSDAYEPFYRILFFFIYSLLNQEGDGLGSNNNAENYAAILAIFRTVKKAEDATKDPKTDLVHIVCDLGISIINEMGRIRLYSESFSGVIPLPSSLYKVHEGSSKDDGIDLPVSLTERDIFSQFWSKCTQHWQTLSYHAHKGPRRIAGDCNFLPVADRNGKDKPSMKQRNKLQEPKEEQKGRINKKAQQESSMSSAGIIGNRILRSLNEESISLEDRASPRKKETVTPSRRQTRRSLNATIDVNPVDPLQGQTRSPIELKSLMQQTIIPSPKKELGSLRRQTRRSLDATIDVNPVDPLQGETGSPSELKSLMQQTIIPSPKRELSASLRRQTRRSTETNIDANPVDPRQVQTRSANGLKSLKQEERVSVSPKKELGTPSRKQTRRLIEKNTGFSSDQKQGEIISADDVKASIQQGRRSPAFHIYEGNEASSLAGFCNSEIDGGHLSGGMTLRSHNVVRKLKLNEQNNQSLIDAVAAPVTNQKTVPETFNNRSSKKRTVLASPIAGDQQASRTNMREIRLQKSKGVRKVGDKLVGSRIRVWCHDSQRFCTGTVVLFDLRRNFHKVAYDNGRISCVQLTDEQWDIVEEDSAAVKVGIDSISNGVTLRRRRALEKKGDACHADILEKESEVFVSGDNHSGDDDSLGGRSKRQRCHALTESVKTDRVLRSQDTMQKSEPENTAVLSDDEPTTTWRSRRRKLQ